MYQTRYKGDNEPQVGFRTMLHVLKSWTEFNYQGQRYSHCALSQSFEADVQDSEPRTP